VRAIDSSLFRFIWQHSRRDQISILILIVASLPFYWASLDIPKLIVNDALQGRAFKGGNTTATLFKFSLSLPEWLGGGTYQLSQGFTFDQLGYLFALSGLFLVFVLINGAFKYWININKGVLGERMLRRLRYELFALLLRFRPEDIRAVKPAEAASMIKDEVEPIGGFIGDAFIQPAFLGTQALTALIFILTQSFWLGMVAMAVVLIQAFVIPILRKEQLRLARERQIVSRRLAGRIGEIVEGAPAIHVHGTATFSEADVAHRLGRLFDIRVDLFKRKFAVKYLNNFLAQTTPFFFYAIGGYFALRGSLDIGQLVAVIAAYRDLPPPIKELIDWDQQRNDVTVKYQQIVAQFTVEQLLPSEDHLRDEQVTPQGHIVIDALRIMDQRGNTLLEQMSTTIERPSHVALVGASGSGRDLVARVLGRQISEYQGNVLIGGQNLARMSDAAVSRFLAYAGAEAFLFSGTIRDNVAFSLRRSPPAAAAEAPEREHEVAEAERSGNPTWPAEADWTDYAAAGASGPEDLDRAILRALKIVGMDRDVYRYGLLGRLGSDRDPEFLDRIVAARGAVADRLRAQGLMRLVDPFDPDLYNRNATIGENLVFGVPRGARLAGMGLAADPYLRSILEAEALIDPLLHIGVRIAETMLEVFADLPPGHPLFERFSLIESSEMDEYRKLVESARSRDGRRKLTVQGTWKLISLALSYVEPRHRLSLLNDGLIDRVLRARLSFDRYLPAEYLDEIEFYNPSRVMMAAPLRDNLLFGRVAYGVSNAEEKVAQVLEAVLHEMGLEMAVYALGLEYDVGPAGKVLFATQRAAIGLARCLVRAPDVLVIDGALSPYGAAEARILLGNIRKAMAGKTLLVTLADRKEAEGFERVIEFEGPRAVRGLDLPSRTPEGAKRPYAAADLELQAES
jgi:putative ABC transport system ATP-binding protein